jgi:DNA-binding transcriptional MerR regulator
MSETPDLFSAAAKSEKAYLPIREAAAEIGVATHVLRFWEGKFPLKPMKRAGGRRYYGPEDMDLLRHIQKLLKEEKLTIKGAQARMKEEQKNAPEPSIHASFKRELLIELKDILRSVA